MLPPNTAIRKQKIGNNEYIYLDTNWYSKKTRRSDHKRKYLGKLEEGFFVPNKNYLLEMADKGEEKANPPRSEIEKLYPFKEELFLNRKPAKKHRPKIEDTEIYDYGAIWLLEQMARKIGLKHDLEAIFGPMAEMILQSVFFLTLNPDESMALLESWIREHFPFWQAGAEDIHTMFQWLSQDLIDLFLGLWHEKGKEQKQLLYLIPSSYGLIDPAEKKKDSLELNLAILLGSQSGLPRD